MQQVLHFLNQLAANNNREWFNTHKQDYLQAFNRFLDFSQSWLDGLVEIDPTCSGLSPKDCIWRIYRDTRFSANKLPYKDHFGCFPAPMRVPGNPNTGGKHSDRGGYYVHIQPGACMFAAGIWGPTPELLKALRTEVSANYEELEALFADAAFRSAFQDIDSTWSLKRVPQGFDPNHPHADWLKCRAYLISTYFTDDEVCAPDFLNKVLELTALAKPFNDFLNYTFEEYGEFAERRF